MAESTAETVRKILTEIFHVGEGSSETDGAVKSIENATRRIVTCLTEVESKPEESNVSSAPREFICPLSYTIMCEPVLIASGHTYEKRYIMHWLIFNHTCPKTKHVLSNLMLTPNLLVYDLISQWCLDNNLDRPNISYETDTDLFSHGIDSLLNRLSSPDSSVEDQTEASRGIRLQTKKFPIVRSFFVSQLSDCITRLISPLKGIDTNQEIRKNIIKTLFIFSCLNKNKTVIAETPSVISILTESLKLGTEKTRRYSAKTLLSLSVVSSNRLIIGNSETIKALIGLIKEEGGDFEASRDSSIAVCNLCLMPSKREMALSEGFIRALTEKIKETDDESLINVLARMCVYEGVSEEIVELGFVSDLLSILRKTSTTVSSCESVLSMVLSATRNEDVVKMVGEEEKKHGTFTKLMDNEESSDDVVCKVDMILELVKECRDL